MQWLRSRKIKIALGIVGALTLLFAFTLLFFFRQLDLAFKHQDEHLPTRIYSDLTKIAPPLARKQVATRLNALRYSLLASDPESIHIQLHSPDYPLDLIPADHPFRLAVENSPSAGQFANSSSPLIDIQFHFEGSSPESALQSIEVDGQELPEIFLEPELVATISGEKNHIRSVLKLDEIPSAVWQAIIAVEDQNFLEHRGFDPRGIARAIWINLKTLSFAQGGSTITQQLIKNLMVRRGKNLLQKVNELFLALILEVRYSKEEILERYLNEVYLGQVGPLEVHGVGEGAKHFFGKDLSQLHLGEISMIAGLIRGPGFYSPYRHWERARERQTLVLKKMVETGMIAEAEAQDGLKLPIRLAPPQTTTNKAAYFSDYVKAELITFMADRMPEEEVVAQGFRIYTTLDLEIQAKAQKAVAQGISSLERRFLPKNPSPFRLEGALATADHSTGYLRALVGGKNYAESTFNRILNMKRQVGSTFKPFVYLAGLEKRADENGVPYTPAYPIEDGPWTLTYDNKRQSWSPKNYEGGYRGWVTMREALSQSLNTPTARFGIQVGLDSIIETGRKMGARSDLPKVPSLILGIAELTPIELLRMYATLANRGIFDDLTAIRAITDYEGEPFAQFVRRPKEVFSAAPIDLLTDILTSVFSEGTAKAASALGWKRPAAGKTGTTSQYRDAWFAGYTPQLTTVTWVGWDEVDESKMKQLPKLTGANAALPIWISFMNAALENEPPITFPESPDLISLQVDRYSGRAVSADCSSMQTLMEKAMTGSEELTKGCETQYPTAEPRKTLSR